MGRILGIDYGTRRVGLALSDPLGLTAQPFGTWTLQPGEDPVRRLAELVRERSVERVVVGRPLTLKGRTSRQCAETESFALRLAASCAVPVDLWDERLTTVQAHRVIHELGGRPSRERERVDTVAAALMLQTYLDHRSESGSHA